MEVESHPVGTGKLLIKAFMPSTFHVMCLEEPDLRVVALLFDPRFNGPGPEEPFW